MSEGIPSYREYQAARFRWDEHQRLSLILPDHTYPLRAQDIKTCLRFLEAHGEPPSGVLARLVWLTHKLWRRGPGGRGGPARGEAPLDREPGDAA